MTTSVRDRTQEFFTIVERLHSRQGKKADFSANENSSSATSEFANEISSFNSVLSNCKLHLLQLSQSGQSRSVFEDDSQLHEITGILKKDLNLAQIALKNMQQKYLQQRSVHHERVLQSQAQKLSEITKEFQNALKQKKEKLKAVNERRSKFYGATSIPQGSLMPIQDSELRQRHLQSVKDDFRQSGEQHMEQMEGEPVFSQARNTLSAVESSITQLGTMFQQLTGMVQQQNELAVRIDEDIEGAYQNVDAGQKSLLKFMKLIKSNRGLILKMLGVILTVCVIYLIIA